MLGFWDLFTEIGSHAISLCRFEIIRNLTFRKKTLLKQEKYLEMETNLTKKAMICRKYWEGTQRNVLNG